MIAAAGFIFFGAMCLSLIPKFISESRNGALGFVVGLLFAVSAALGIIGALGLLFSAVGFLGSLVDHKIEELPKLFMYSIGALVVSAISMWGGSAIKSLDSRL